MSDMTKEETRKYRALTSTSSGIISAEKIVDYLNSIHVDYMDELLSSGAAIKAPKSMYKKKKQS
jgi:Fe-S cluster assembly iron-binding protein IscA